MALVPYSHILAKCEDRISTSFQTTESHGCLSSEGTTQKNEDFQSPQVSHFIQQVMDHPTDSYFIFETPANTYVNNRSCSKNFHEVDRKWTQNTEKIVDDQQLLSYYREKRIQFPSAKFSNVETNSQSFTSLQGNNSSDPENSCIYQEIKEVNKDQDWIHSWLLSHEIETHVPDTSDAIYAKQLKVWEIKTTLQYAWKTLNELDVLGKEISFNLGKLAESEWNMKVEEIDSIKDGVQKQLDLIDKGRLKRAKVALLKRAKKRHRLRRKRALIRESLLEKAEDLKLAHLKIDLRLEKRLEHTENIKQEEEMKREADAVLWRVRQKQFEGRNILALLSEIVKLFRIRLSKNGTNDATLKEDEEELDKIIDRLNSLWEDQMKDYKIEEQALRTMLEQNREMNAEGEEGRKGHFRNKQTSHKSWEAIIFGNNYSSKNPLDLEIDSFKPFFSSSLKSLESLVENRKNWDQYISTSPSSTCIPMGWVVPKEPTSGEWFNLIEN